MVAMLLNEILTKRHLRAFLRKYWVDLNDMHESARLPLVSKSSILVGSYQLPHERAADRLKVGAAYAYHEKDGIPHLYFIHEREFLGKRKPINLDQREADLVGEHKVIWAIRELMADDNLTSSRYYKKDTETVNKFEGRLRKARARK